MGIEDKLDFEEFGMFVHGTLFAFHSLGCYNAIKKKEYKHALIHGLVAAYDLGSVYYHYKKSKELKDKGT